VTRRGAGWHAYDHYAYAVVAILGTLVAILAIFWLMTVSPLAGWTQGLAGVAAPLTNVMGVLFGLTLAFLSNDTWSAHDRARAAVLREADAIRGLDVLAEGLPDSPRAEMRGAIAAYVRAAVAEWPALAHSEADTAPRAASDRLLRLAAAPETLATLGTPAQGAMLSAVTAIRESRDARIGLSRTHVNPLKWLGMAFLGFLTLVAIAAIHVDAPHVALTAMSIFGLAAAPTAALVLIHGNPFQPPSAVTPAPIRVALDDRG